MKSFDEKPSPPSRKSPSVWQSLAGLSPRALIAASIVSTAMDRYVVHFPPAIVTSPLLLTRIRWLRAIEAVLLEFGSITNGRIPLQAAKTSPRRTARECVINLYIQWKSSRQFWTRKSARANRHPNNIFQASTTPSSLFYPVLRSICLPEWAETSLLNTFIKNTEH